MGVVLLLFGKQMMAENTMPLLGLSCYIMASTKRKKKLYVEQSKIPFENK